MNGAIMSAITASAIAAQRVHSQNNCKSGNNVNDRKDTKYGAMTKKTTICLDNARVMCKAAEVGKIVVNKCLDIGISINTQKLQKLLVLMQVECVKRSNKPLFKEDIVVWNCGVAIKEVDREFYSEAIGFIEHQQEYISLLDKELESVDYVILKYGTKNSFELNSLPDIQKVIGLCVKSDNTSEPRVCYQILTGAFL